jgi:5-methylcytosine-specific restriction protein A
MALKYCKYPGCYELVNTGYCDRHKSVKRICRFPRCPEEATEGYYCAKHTPRKRADDKRGSSASRGYDYQWAKVRASYLASHPLCENCLLLNTVTPAVLVHHKKRIAEGGAPYDFNNLQSLCYRCHEEIHSSQGDYSPPHLKKLDTV